MMFKNFLKYLLGGIFLAFLRLHFPLVPVAGFALTLGLARGALGPGWLSLLSVLLSLLYAAHSVSPPLAWFLPALLALGLLALWNAFLAWPRPLQGILAMSLILFFQWSWTVLSGTGSPFLGFEFIFVWLGTVLTGWVLLPMAFAVGKKLMRTFPHPKKSMGEMPLYLGKKDRPGRKAWERRPFGLERG